MKVTKVEPVEVMYTVEMTRDDIDQVIEALNYAVEMALWEHVDRQASYYGTLAYELEKATR